MVGEQGPGEEQTDGDGADAEHMPCGIERRRNQTVHAAKIEQQGCCNGDERRVTKQAQRVAGDFPAAEDRDTGGPHADLDAEAEGEKHADRLAVRKG